MQEVDGQWGFILSNPGFSKETGDSHSDQHLILSHTHKVTLAGLPSLSWTEPALIDMCHKTHDCVKKANPQ